MRVHRFVVAVAVLSVGYSCALLDQSVATRPREASPGILGTPLTSAPHPAAPSAASYLSAPTGPAKPAPVPAAAPMDARKARAVRALDVLAAHVVEQSHPEALERAFEAYYSFKAAHPEQVRKPYLYFVDFGLDNRTARGYVFDMEKLALVEGPFMVAHGRGSSLERDGVPTRFTNRSGSAATSLGLYLTQETYGFSGTSGGRHYRSIGLRMKGLSGHFNGAARSRGIVVHGAPYVTESQAGRSEGCPAMEQSRAERLIPMISGGSLVFHFSPNDPAWMQEDPWTSVLD